MSGFQKQVNTYSSPAALGQIASGNPTAWYVAGPGALVAGALGVLVGRFAWATAVTAGDTPERVDNNPLLVADGANRAPSGFVPNEQQALTTVYLAESGLTIQAGCGMELCTRGDFWGANWSVGAAVRGQQVFANLQDGSLGVGTAGAILAPNAGTASFATNVMTVTVAPAAPLKVGDAITSTGVAANTYIKAFGTGTGGTGTYTLTTTPGTIAAQAFTGSSWIETKFKVLSAALVSEFVKIGFGD